MISLQLLIPAHLLAMLLYWYAPRFWIKLDVAEFNLNGGTKDDNHGTFHRQRLLWRAGITVAVALVCSLPYVASGKLYVASCIGLACLGAAYFFYAFTPGLNMARALAYVPKYYVSFDPKAAYFPDRLLARRAYRAYPVYPAPESESITHQNRVAYAADELRRLLRAALLAGLAVYAAAVAFLFFF
jgi:hypothetical protein